MADAWSSYMFDRFLKMSRVLNKPRFWIWHGCICNGYVEFRIFLIMFSYASVIPKYASICLNVPQFDWTWVNITECPWICLQMLEETVPTMPGFSICRDIVTITLSLLKLILFVMLKFFARSIHPGRLLSFYLFLALVKT